MCNVPHGFGRLIFKKGVNKHPEIKNYNPKFKRYYNLNHHDYILYEGDFKYGHMHGPGVLKLRGQDTYGQDCDRILEGQFQMG